jgi:hypothetical protein
VAGGGPAPGWRGRGSLAQQSPEKKRQWGGSARAPLTVEGFATVEAVGQRRWRTRAGARRLDGDVVGFGHGRWRGQDGARETRRGEAASTARATFSDTTGWDGYPPGAFGHRRPQQPIRALREATLPLTAGPHSSAFSLLKIIPGWK